MRRQFHHNAIAVLQLVSVLAVSPSRAAAFPRAIYQFNSIENECLRPMVVAKNNDDYITDREIPEFVQLLALANGITDPIFEVKSTKYLPPQLIIAINNLICGEESICPPGINVAGAANINSVDEKQRKFLQTVCSKMVSTMKDVLPTPAPTSSPPTRSPSRNPTSSPSKIPTRDPTMSPTRNPTMSPTSSPSSAPVITPTPSQYPSDKPSEEPIETAIIPFGMVNMYGLSGSEVAQNVAGSMLLIDSVFSDFSQEVENSLFTQTIGGRRNLRFSDMRILGVEFKSDQYVTNIQDHGCTQAILDQFKNRSPAPKCQQMQGVITYVISGSTNPDVTANIIEVRAEEEIRKNTLNDKVPEELRDDYYFYSLNGGTATMLPVAAITGIAIGAALVGLIAARSLVRRKVRSKNNNEQYDGLNGPSNTIEDEEFDSNTDACSPTYSGLASESFDRRNGHDISVEHSVASSSNAGSSGWSSSTGISSLNTGSVDSAEYFGSSLAAIGAASNLTKRYRSSNNSDIYPMAGNVSDSSMSESDIGMSSDLETDDESNFDGHKHRQFAIREELEHAIRHGDWCLVGATAAIIAQSPSDFLTHDVSTTISSGLASSVGASQQKNERAVEIEKLVEAGDWEGVVLAAAKFETESDKDIVTEGSASISEGQQFLAARSLAQQSDANSTTSPSISTNISDSLSNNVKRAEFRAEVEALVRRVVPDEIDNVDEMMHQFSGREEELVETLRTMQERSIAARQREAMRRNAKREARRLAKQNKSPSGRLFNLNEKSASNSSLLSTNSNFEYNCNDSKVSTPSKGNSTRNSILTPNRAALDHAIKMGDWEAVGRTAEKLGDGSVSCASEYLSTDDISVMSASDRAAELEGLIDQGDWSAVVAAASRFATADNVVEDQTKPKPVVKPLQLAERFDDQVSQSTETKNTKTRREEEDALAQAEIWMAIAAQSKKNDSSATKGASDAADWAISRSLKQIQASSNHKHETQSAASSRDDKSV